MSKSKEENPFEGFNVLDLTGKQVDPDIDENQEEEKEEIPIEETIEDTEEIKEETESVEVDNKKEIEIKEEDSIKPFVKFLSDKGIIDYDESDEIEDSEEGIAQIIEKTLDKREKKRLESKSEILRKAIEFEENGGSFEEFINIYYNEVDYDSVIIEEDNVDIQKAVLIDYLKLQEESDEDIEELLEKYETSGILETESKRALKKLQKISKENKEAKIEEKKKEKILKEQNIKTEWENLKKSLDEKEEIKGFKLTPKLKEKLWDHIYKPVKDGKSQLKLNNENNKDAQFLYAYLDLIGWDLSKLEKSVETKITSNLRKTLGKFTDTRNKLGTSSGATKIEEDSPFEGFKKLKI